MSKVSKKERETIAKLVPEVGAEAVARLAAADLHSVAEVDVKITAWMQAGGRTQADVFYIMALLLAEMARHAGPEPWRLTKEAMLLLSGAKLITEANEDFVRGVCH